MNNATWMLLHAESFFSSYAGLFIGIMCLNFILSALLSYIVVYIIGALSVKNKRWYFFLLTCEGTFIPGLGLLIIISMGILTKKLKYATSEISTLTREDYVKEKPIRTLPYGGGWARIRLESSHFNIMERQQALRSISKGFDKNTNKIFKQLLSDKGDELRLYAFGLLENQQNIINKKITALLHQSQRNQSRQNLAYLEKDLALLYWQMIDLNLAGNEITAFVIQKSEAFAHKALEILATDAFLWLLLSKIYFYQDLQEKGFQTLLKAKELGAPPNEMYPYFAAYFFQKRDYNQVREYLSADISLKNLPEFGKIVQFWCQHESL